MVPILRGEGGQEDNIYVIPGQIRGLGDIKEFLAICGKI
jgi:hypothetical protein